MWLGNRAVDGIGEILEFGDLGEKKLFYFPYFLILSTVRGIFGFFFFSNSSRSWIIIFFFLL